MALAVLDGNQSATTLSSVVTGGEHIVAHSVVSLGSNAISNITTAVSGSVVTIPNLNVLARSVATDGIADSTLNFVKIGGHQDGSNQTAHIVHVSGGGAMKVDASDSTVTFGAISGTVTIGNTVTIAGTVTANPTGTQTIAGTVTANAGNGFITAVENGIFDFISNEGIMPISGTVTANIPLVNIQPAVTTGLGVILLTDEGKSVFDNSSSIKATLTTALPAGTNRIGVVTIGGGTVTLGAGTAQIGSVTASISNSVVTFYPMQGTTVTNSNFTSTTASTTLVSAVANREVLTVFNEGAGNLHISPAATCTTVAYQVRLSAGDYWECPAGQLSLAHTAVFATAGTARVTEVS